MYSNDSNIELKYTTLKNQIFLSRKSNSKILRIYLRNEIFNNE